MLSGSCVPLASASAAWQSMPLGANGCTNSTDWTALGGERLEPPASTEDAAKQDNIDGSTSPRDDKAEDSAGSIALESRCPLPDALTTDWEECANELACTEARLIRASLLMSSSLLSITADMPTLCRSPFASRATFML